MAKPRPAAARDEHGPGPYDGLCELFPWSIAKDGQRRAQLFQDAFQTALDVHCQLYLSSRLIPRAAPRRSGFWVMYDPTTTIAGR